MAETVRTRIRVDGVVQGVGFRPFAQALAARLGLSGFVANDADGALVEVEGSPDGAREFLERLRSDAPALAEIRAVRAERVAALGEQRFAIVASRRGAERRALVSPDVATCEACLRDLADPADRRYRHAFASCTHCGPRFTIVRDVPYDRARTALAEFPLCADCAREYADPGDRRHHAQSLCCPACGPRLALRERSGAPVAGDPVEAAARRLRAGEIVAVKGLGGYHLAALASDEAAVARLRRRKRRSARPFAVLLPDLAWARRLVQLAPEEERALSGPARPILLAARRPDAPVAASVAPGCSALGILLPYTPLHHLLGAAVGEPCVLTSGNVSDEPIAFRDADAAERLAPLADAFLDHDRPIEIGCDDSVVRVRRGRELVLRRARGHAPRPLALPWRVRRPILACGAELKSTFCLAKGDRAFLSHHLGDLESFETLLAYRRAIGHFQRLFEIRPALVAHDLHPEYLSTKHALELDDVELVGVQHHHAHAASCLAEHGETGPALAVCWDGLGYGEDGALWGGEFLVAELGRFRRAAHLRYVPMPGGVAAIRQPWRMAAAHLDDAFQGAPPGDLDVVRRHGASWERVLALARSRAHAPPTSSVGRLFDAAAALLGIRDEVDYEGQAAIELEQRCDAGEDAGYPARIEEGDPLQVRGGDLIAALVEDLRRGTDPARIAARFHHGLVRCLLETCRLLRARTGLARVVLSGGVFQNAFLEERAVAALEAAGFAVLTHSRVPPNDGGISFGQLAVAAACDRCDA